jgi:hypothetical protein
MAPVEKESCVMKIMKIVKIVGCVALGIFVGVPVTAVIIVKSIPPIIPGSSSAVDEQIRIAQVKAEQDNIERRKRDADLDCKYGLDWSKCADNTAIAQNTSLWHKIGAACMSALENNVKYGAPKWPWMPFSNYNYGMDYVLTGKAVAIEPNVQLQNGFGAMVHSKAVCTYDLRAEKVTNLQVIN